MGLMLADTDSISVTPVAYGRGFGELVGQHLTSLVVLQTDAGNQSQPGAFQSA